MVSPTDFDPRHDALQLRDIHSQNLIVEEDLHSSGFFIVVKEGEALELGSLDIDLEDRLEIAIQ